MRALAEAKNRPRDGKQFTASVCFSDSVLFGERIQLVSSSLQPSLYMIGSVLHVL